MNATETVVWFLYQPITVQRDIRQVSMSRIGIPSAAYENTKQLVTTWSYGYKRHPLQKLENTIATVPTYMWYMYAINLACIYTESEVFCSCRLRGILLFLFYTEI